MNQTIHIYTEINTNQTNPEMNKPRTINFYEKGPNIL